MPSITVNETTYNYNEDRSPGPGPRYLQIGVDGVAYGAGKRPSFLLIYMNGDSEENIHNCRKYNTKQGEFYHEAAIEAATWHQSKNPPEWPKTDERYDYYSNTLKDNIRLRKNN